MPYSKFNHDDLTLRDHLAIDRTELANERTLLAYSRTGIAVFVTGVSLIHFLTNLLLEIAGGIFIAGSLLIFFVGVRRFLRVKNSIANARSIRRKK